MVLTVIIGASWCWMLRVGLVWFFCGSAMLSASRSMGLTLALAECIEAPSRLRWLAGGLSCPWYGSPACL